MPLLNHEKLAALCRELGTTPPTLARRMRVTATPELMAVLKEPAAATSEVPEDSALLLATALGVSEFRLYMAGVLAPAV